MQRFITAILCSIVWLTGVVSDVEAGISVRYRAYGSTDNTAWTSTLPGGSSITYDYTNWQSNTEGVTVTISGDGDWWFRCANPGTESIGKIVFSGSGNVRLFITAPDGSGLGPTDLSTSAALGHLRMSPLG
ncbi:MAG TPA: hypothetical protein PKE29_14005 [Phycisphaerales bacterium]|nr:hypothetical protein [Phycisphaerales bacterium]